MICNDYCKVWEIGLIIQLFRDDEQNYVKY